MSFSAKYPGHCHACDEPIKVMQECTYNAADEVVHVICPEAVPGKARPACPHCFCEIPPTGRCDCRD